MFDFDVQRYLERIGIISDLPGRGDYPAPTIETLTNLQAAHLMTVPYENFDLVNHDPIGLKTEDLFNKIVNHRRGGYSFELNGAFGDLLRSMNFDVTEHLSRFMLDSEEVPMRLHRVLKVHFFDATYICDVGLGVESPRIPIKLEEDTVQSDGFAEYRLERDPFHGWMLWQKKKMDGWKKFYTVSDEICLTVDFTAANFWCAESKDSPFNKEIRVCLRTDGGLNTFDGKTFRIVSSDREARLLKPEDKRDCADKLREYFGLNIAL